MQERISVDDYKALAKPRSKRHKYGAKQRVVDGIKFDSHAEARRYKTLQLMAKAGEISNLELQPKLPFCINGQKVFTLVADFRYQCTRRGEVIEDVKGFPTETARLKKKIVEADRDITINWVDGSGKPVSEYKRKRKRDEKNS